MDMLYLFSSLWGVREFREATNELYGCVGQHGLDGREMDEAPLVGQVAPSTIVAHCLAVGQDLVELDGCARRNVRVDRERCSRPLADIGSVVRRHSILQDGTEDGQGHKSPLVFEMTPDIAVANPLAQDELVELGRRTRRQRRGYREVDAWPLPNVGAILCRHDVKAIRRQMVQVDELLMHHVDELRFGDAMRPAGEPGRTKAMGGPLWRVVPVPLDR